jgi:oligopeptide/dipeptide ABC transporter ATP-binding protein
MPLDPLLSVENLDVRFDTPEGRVRAVDGVGFDLDPGETLGLVGESGCGKSVTALSLIGLLPSPPARVRADRIRFEGRDLTAMSAERLRRIRGREIAMVFQEPMTSLNPVLPIGRQVAEPLMTHQGLSRREARLEALRWLEHVKIPAAPARLQDYPYQLSGGMRQRVMIAMAMVCRPKLLIADEPTTALDVTIQAQILSLMLSLKKELSMSMILITHDLGLVAQMARRVAVMYAGQVVEEATVIDVFDRPAHPYTQGLLRSLPRSGGVGGRLTEIKGLVPTLIEPPAGCRFADRCERVFEPCRVRRPPLFEVGPAHRVRCWLHEPQSVR